MKSKKLSQRRCGPATAGLSGARHAQPLLPSINLARLIVGPEPWCDCDCPLCPPWYHYSSECPCMRALSDVPPLRNTGVHRTPRLRGASSSHGRGKAQSSGEE